MEVNKDSFEENLSKFSPQFSERYNAYLESLAKAVRNKKDLPQENEVLFTFDEFDQTVKNIAIDALFLTKDVSIKPIFSNDTKVGMSYYIMPHGMHENYYIGFVKDDQSPYIVWNGKMDNFVFEIDEHTGAISYMTPSTDICYEGLSMQQIKIIGDTIAKHFKEDVNKQPLQDSPTSSEETSAEVDLPERMYKMENSNLDEYTITQKVFDTTKLHVGKAYRIINPITGETTDGILESIDFDKLVFGWFYPTDNSWQDFTFGLDSIIRIIPLNIEEPNTTVKPEKVISDDLYIRTYSDLADDGCGKYPLFVKDESDKYYIINYDVLSKYMSMKDVVFEISYRAGEHIVGYGVFKPSELYVHVAGTTLTATVKDSTDSRKIKHTLEIRADDMNLFLYVHVNIKRSKEKK